MNELQTILITTIWVLGILAIAKVDLLFFVFSGGKFELNPYDWICVLFWPLILIAFVVLMTIGLTLEYINNLVRR